MKMNALTNTNSASIAIHKNPVMYRNRDKHFAAGFNFYKFFWIFTIGSVIGFVVETIWCLVTNGHFEVRSSFVLGPFTIVYGIGAVVLYLGLRKVDRSKTGRIFLFGVVGGTVVELIASWIQEVAFGTVSWDYSNLPLNINGRVCLLCSVFWGAGGSVG